MSTDSYTVPQLVNSVLINSPCVSATNVTWSTGSNFGTTNGIGFFQNTNAGFPIQSGVVLSTGSATNASGPNTTLLSDGNNSWPGDTSLENTLAASGIAMNSVNATVLEFDFTPMSAQFSFDFVFASEEYGNYQCQFSDAFAFLLTNVNTGITTNLAVVPGSNSPISVVTIRDFLYNSSCPSANAQYFGSFNGGSNAAGSATNFNGQTVLMNASAVLTPNVPYHIKLVIADRTDYESDSAIFIASDSFNIGQDVLGNDLTIANGGAICPGQTATLDTGLTGPYTFTWKRNNVLISGQTGSTLDITQGGTYEVIYDNTTDGCPPVSDLITVQYYPTMTTPNPVNLFRCGTGAATYSYNLALNTPVVSGSLSPAPVVTYHASEANANLGTGNLPLNYNAAPGTTVYVRIKNATTGCYIVKSFVLDTTTGPTAAQAPDMTACERSYTLHNGIFSFNDQTPIILNGQSSATTQVSYYTSLANAQSGTSPLSSVGYVGNNNTVIYVRVQNASDTNCYVTSSFTLHLIPLPPVDSFEDVVVCDSYTLMPLVNGNYFSAPNGGGNPMHAGDVITETATIYIYNSTGTEPNCAGNSNFKVTVVKPEDMTPSDVTRCSSYPLPALEYGEYHTEPGGAGTVINAGTVIPATQTVYYYFETDTEPSCIVDSSFQVSIVPGIEVGTHPNIFDCTSYTLPPLAVGKYYDQANGAGSEIEAGTVITQTQTIYVYAETGSTPNCTDSDSFNVVIGFENPTDIVQCEPYVLPQLPAGGYFTEPGGQGTPIEAGTPITGNETVYVYIEGNGGCIISLNFNISIAQPPIDSLDDQTVCGNYQLPALTNGHYYDGPQGTGNSLNAGDLIIESKTIYIYSAAGVDCYNQSDFIVTVKPPAEIESRANVAPCNAYTLTPLAAGNYFSAPGGTGTALFAGDIIHTTQTIYIYAPGDEAHCPAENSFLIDIFPLEADAPAPVSECDSYTLPALTIGNYYTLSGGPSTVGNVQKHAGDAITATTTLYVYTESGDRLNCFDENTFDITITASPVLPAFAPVKVCDSYELPVLALGDYYTGADKTGTLMHAGDILTSSQTLFIYAENGNCSDQAILDITIFNVAELPDVVSCSSYALPALPAGGYYASSLGTGVHFPVGGLITTSRTVYVYAQSPFNPACYDESSFEVTIVPQPVANAVSPSLVTLCDEDGNNDGAMDFNFTQLNATVLGTQTGSEFAVTYYNSMADANAGTNAITISHEPIVYAKVVNSLAPDCYAVRPIQMIVHRLPEPTAVNGYMCYDQETQTVLNPYIIHSGLSASTHTFEWYDSTGALVGTGSTYTAMLPGDYMLLTVNNATGCSSLPVTITVTGSEPAELTFSTSDSFNEHQSLTIHAIGTGNYEYSIDGGAWQSSPDFAGMGSGVHIVTVRDLNGCDNATINVLLVNYPHYFTPNGDGYNDTWNITDLYQQETSIIKIFDRYGKYLAEIRPAGSGWDGTLNGKPLPSTDYWFTVDYDENGSRKEFKAHFSLKR
ncbi:T9SS type B sorting domain-containing protein [Flavobacterium silvaticum]|uniref:T9SS type B sorting domain-containing protein n=1 Tax=Flavobacterium silvaticum TaxID=1852020 RepID=A0A972FWQ7_9FLAO|nr:choice-of-anchor L domain-containing protein [Flavobacterium silvaticum]NMH29422.1 T9SS type B sorting domain-containing protein [Flavobacterium silvaticum]